MQVQRCASKMDLVAWRCVGAVVSAFVLGTARLQCRNSCPLLAECAFDEWFVDDGLVVCAPNYLALGSDPWTISLPRSEPLAAAV